MYSVTSGTIFASRKLAFTDLCGAICIFVNAVKGLSALQLSRDLNVQYKTAFVLAHKLREALASETKDGEPQRGSDRPAPRPVPDRHPPRWWRCASGWAAP